MTEKSSVQVAVRIRPLNKRERNNSSILNIKNKSLIITHYATKKRKKFNYDFLFNSDTTQEQVYNDIGKQVIDNAINGYNSCVFAYGLTGCFAARTPILLYNGTFKNVENIDTNDILMGDDSKPRRVKCLFRGKQTMYKIKPDTKGYEPYIVNENHQLVLCADTSPYIRWLNTNQWEVSHYNPDIHLLQKIVFNTKDEANQYMDTITTQNKIIEMSVLDFIKMPSYKKRYLKCFTTKVEFKATKILVNSFVLGYLIGSLSSIKNITLENINSVYNKLHQQYNYKVTNKERIAINAYNLHAIPNEYKINTAQVRNDFLNGFICAADNTSNISTSNTTNISTSNTTNISTSILQILAPQILQILAPQIPQIPQILT